MAGEDAKADKKPGWLRRKFGAGSREQSPRRSQASSPLPTEQRSSGALLEGISQVSITVPALSGTEPPPEHDAELGSAKDPEPKSGPTKPAVEKSDGSTVWKAAYERLKTESPDLVAPYVYLIESSVPGLKDVQRTFSDIVTDNLKALESKKWKPKFRGKPVDVRGVLDDVLKLIKVVMPVASVAGSLDPVHAGLPLAGVQVLLDLLSNDSGEQNAAMDGAKAITNMIIRYREVENDYIGETPLFSREYQDEFLRMRTDLYFQTLEYQAKAACYFGKDTISRFFRNLPKLDGWQDLLKGIEESDKRCIRYAREFDAKHQRDGMERIQRKFDEALQKLRREDELNEKILSWVSQMDTSADHNRVGERLTDTYKDSGSWLFSLPQYTDWCSSESKGKSTLFLRGPAGTGKSSLAFQVAESHLKQQATREDHGLAIFYCSRKALGSEQKTAVEILRSLVRQLSWSADYMTVPDVVRDAYSKAHASSVTINPRDEDWRGVFAVLQKKFKSTTVILDALDECLEHESLLEYLQKTHDETSNLNIFATCRLDVKVVKFFPAFVDVRVSDHTQKDISSYVRNEVSNRVTIFNDDKDADIRNQLITELEIKAQGMFQWVKLQLAFFTQARTRKTAMKKLNDLRESTRIPELNEVYEEILQFNTGYQDGTEKNEEPTNEYELKLAIRALQLVFVAQLGLTFAQLVDAISISEDGEVDEDLKPALLSELCANLLTSKNSRDEVWSDGSSSEANREGSSQADKEVSSEAGSDTSTEVDGTAEFTHLSVRDWLSKRKDSTFRASDCSFLELSHIYTVKTSLLYLQHSESLTSYNRQKKEDTFQWYAESYWPFDYSRLSIDKRKLHLLEVVKGFIFTDSGLTDMFKAWSQNLAYLEKEVLDWVKMPDTDNKSVLVLACCYDCPELLEAQKDVIGFEIDGDFYVSKKSGRNALHLAAERGSKSMIDYLLAANTECTSELRWKSDQPTALMMAIINKHEDIALKLIPYTSLRLLSETNSRGQTVLNLAESRGLLRVVAALLEVLPKEVIVWDPIVWDPMRYEVGIDIVF